jgi:hypothetical protein
MKRKIKKVRTTPFQTFPRGGEREGFLNLAGKRESSRVRMHRTIVRRLKNP